MGHDSGTAVLYGEGTSMHEFLTDVRQNFMEEETVTDLEPGAYALFLTTLPFPNEIQYEGILLGSLPEDVDPDRNYGVDQIVPE